MTPQTQIARAIAKAERLFSAAHEAVDNLSIGHGNAADQQTIRDCYASACSLQEWSYGWDHAGEQEALVDELWAICEETKETVSEYV